MANIKQLPNFLFSKSNATVVADGATTLYTSSGTANLADGQLGIFAVGLNGSSNYTAINSGDTVVEAPEIIIAQGTPYSAVGGETAVAGIFSKIYETSHRIRGAETRVWRGQAYVAPRQNAWVVGADSGAIDEIGRPLDETTYSIRVTFRGRRRDYSNSTNALDSVFAQYTTKDYTTLGYTDAQATDDLVQNLVSELNKRSQAVTTNGRRGNRPFVALAIRHEGSFSGANSTTNVSDLDSLDGGVAITGYGLSTDAETAAANNNSAMGAAFAALVADTAADVDTDTQVVDINLTTAGTATSGCNGIIIMALDEKIAYDDRNKHVKVRLSVDLPDGFDTTVGKYESSDTNEGEGAPRQLRIDWRYSQGLRERENLNMIPIVEPADYISNTEVYSVYGIVTRTVDYRNGAPSGFNEAATYICVPNGDTTTKNALEAALNAYFGSVNLPAVNI